MTKLFVHAKLMIDGVSDTPKFDQLISIEDGIIVSIEEYHETTEEVIHVNVVTQYIKDHDNGITNFHFEISADLLRENELELMSTMRPGLIQLEIGVQSTNPDTIRAIHRTMDFPKLAGIVNRIHSFKNIHQHLDLIVWSSL